MRLFQILKEDATRVWSVRMTDHWVEEGDPEDYQDDISVWRYDILFNGVVIGELTEDNFFGYMKADFGERTVEISKYEPKHSPQNAVIDFDSSDKEAFEGHAASTVKSYFTTPKGQQHFEIMSRQKGLKPQSIELEEEDRCVTCDGTGKQLVGDDQLVFDCPDCKDEELEERKVTKTMAGKQQRPIDKLAVDTKKKKPNQGKEPVELDKFKDTKDLANEILKGEYNQ